MDFLGGDEISHILNFLGLRQLVALRRVDQQWRAIADAHTSNILARLADVPREAKAVRIFDALSINGATRRLMTSAHEGRPDFVPIPARRNTTALHVVETRCKLIGFAFFACELNKRDEHRRRIRIREQVKYEERWERIDTWFAKNRPNTPSFAQWFAKMKVQFPRHPNLKTKFFAQCDSHGGNSIATRVACIEDGYSRVL